MKKVTVFIFKMTFSLHVEKDNNTFNFTLLFKGREKNTTVMLRVS